MELSHLSVKVEIPIQQLLREEIQVAEFSHFKSLPMQLLILDEERILRVKSLPGIINQVVLQQRRQEQSELQILQPI
jgi:hypothetical protein